MIRKLLVIFFLIALLVVSFIIIQKGISDTDEEQGALRAILPESPLFASFQIDGQEVQLVDGSAEGLDSGLEDGVLIETALPPVYGDITGDGRDDALLLLTRSEDGEEKTYYLATALKDTQGFLGMNAVPLELKEVPTNITVQDELAIVSYTDQTLPEVLSDEGVESDNSDEKNEDSEQMTQVYFFALTGTTLQAVGPTPGDEAVVLRGEYTFTGKSRVITSCESGVTYNISPNSKSYAALEAIYNERTRGTDSHTPIYIVLVGSDIGASGSGEGGGIAQNINVSGILRVPKQGGCVAQSE